MMQIGKNGRTSPNFCWRSLLELVSILCVKFKWLTGNKRTEQVDSKTDRCVGVLNRNRKFFV